MADILNLNRARKARARADREAQAAENRTRFGRTKHEKAAEKANTEQVARLLDQHRLERSSDSET